MKIEYVKKTSIETNDKFYEKALDVILDQFDPEEYLNDDESSLNIENTLQIFNENSTFILDIMHDTTAFKEELFKKPTEFYSYDLSEMKAEFKTYLNNKFKS